MISILANVNNCFNLEILNFEVIFTQDHSFTKSSIIDLFPSIVTPQQMVWNLFW